MTFVRPYFRTANPKIKLTYHCSTGINWGQAQAAVFFEEKKRRSRVYVYEAFVQSTHISNTHIPDFQLSITNTSVAHLLRSLANKHPQFSIASSQIVSY